VRAAVYSRASLGGVALAEVPRPTLAAAGEAAGACVVCRVHAAGVNPVDAKFLYGDKLPAACLPVVQRVIEGSICGIDFSGVVTEAAEGCGFGAGDRVFGTIPPLAGTFAEYVCAPVHSIARMPDTLGFAEASALPLVGLTAVQVCDDNALLPGQHVLVLGASGGTGHVGVQIAKIRGATVTALCGQRNTEYVRGLGADRVVAYDDGDCIARFADIVREQGPFDLVFDTVSSHDPRDAGFDYERRIRGARVPLVSARGRYVFIGGQVGDWVRAHVKRFFGIDLFPRGRELFWVRFPHSATQLAELARFWAAQRLRVTVAAALPFTAAGVREAFDAQMSRRAVGKLVIDVAGTSG